MNCSSDLKTFANSRPSALNFKCFSKSQEHFFLTVGQNNFGNKTPFKFEENRRNKDIQSKMRIFQSAKLEQNQ